VIREMREQVDSTLSYQENLKKKGQKTEVQYPYPTEVRQTY